MGNLLVHDWKRVTLVGYSTWAFYALVAVTLAPDLLYKFFEIDTNPVVWGWLQLAICFLGVVGRMILQPPSNRFKRRFVVAIILAVMCAMSLPALASAEPGERPQSFEAFDDVAFDLISKWEGKRNHSYQDIVGVWTICYGHTRTARRGQYKTDQQCRELLVDEISEYRSGLHRYFNSRTIDYRLPVYRDAAYTSLAFNVGIRAAGKSTATRRLNRADIYGGCTALTWWNKAGGRVVRGLVRRRSDERDYCLKDI